MLTHPHSCYLLNFLTLFFIKSKIRNLCPLDAALSARLSIRAPMRASSPPVLSFARLSAFNSQPTGCSQKCASLTKIPKIHAAVAFGKLALMMSPCDMGAHSCLRFSPPQLLQVASGTPKLRIYDSIYIFGIFDYFCKAVVRCYQASGARISGRWGYGSLLTIAPAND